MAAIKNLKSVSSMSLWFKEPKRTMCPFVSLDKRVTTVIGARSTQTQVDQACLSIMCSAIRLERICLRVQPITVTVITSRKLWSHLMPWVVLWEPIRIVVEASVLSISSAFRKYDQIGKCLHLFKVRAQLNRLAPRSKLEEQARKVKLNQLLLVKMLTMRTTKESELNITANCWSNLLLWQSCQVLQLNRQTKEQRKLRLK